ncbi:hypothetical protein EXVC031PHodr_046 [Pelagibacter phage EXVC032P Baldr]|nr:hypothetical protein EXVC031PHodr_046 [Pelagibacter phage EXVC032P Baldr]
MTQRDEGHNLRDSINRDRIYQQKKQSLDKEIEDLDFAINRLVKFNDELKNIFGVILPKVYFDRLEGITNKFIDVLTNLKAKNQQRKEGQNE